MYRIDIGHLVTDILNGINLVKSHSYLSDESKEAIVKDACSQITAAIIRTHEMQALGKQHPAIKDLQEKLQAMTILLRKQDE